MTRRLYVQGTGQMSETDALKKVLEHENQIEALESTVRGHEKSIEECKRQILEIRKLMDPIREGLLKRFAT